MNPCFLFGLRLISPTLYSSVTLAREGTTHNIPSLITLINLIRTALHIHAHRPAQSWQSYWDFLPRWLMFMSSWWLKIIVTVCTSERTFHNCSSGNLVYWLSYNLLIQCECCTWHILSLSILFLFILILEFWIILRVMDVNAILNIW